MQMQAAALQQSCYSNRSGLQRTQRWSATRARESRLAYNRDTHVRFAIMRPAVDTLVQLATELPYVSVCQHDRTKTAIIKLGTGGIVHNNPRPSINIRSKC